MSSSSRRALFGAALTGEEATVVPHQPSPQLQPPRQDKGKQRANNTPTSTAAASQSHPSAAPGRGPQHNQPRNAKQVIQRQAAAALTVKVVPEPVDDDTVRSLSMLCPEEGRYKYLPSLVQGDDDNCFICAEKVVFFALGECDHRTCHTCCIRLRALYKKETCVFCKVRYSSRTR